MLLRTVLSQLLLVGGVCLSGIAVVGAMPVTQGTHALTSSEEVSAFWERLKNTPWIEYDDNNRWNCEGYGKGHEVFAQDMNHLGSQLKGTWLEDPQPRGSNNEGLYTLVSPYFVSKDNQIPGKEIMIKLVDIERRDAPCEVFALRKLKALQEKKGHVVSFVDSGWMKNWHQRIGVIVMHRSPGKPLFALDQWKQGDKVELLNFVRDGLKSIVWELVAELKYIHWHVDLSSQLVLVTHTVLDVSDWRPENVLVDVIDPSTREIHIIDFGQPSIYQIKENRSPTPEEFTVWFNKQFDFLWKYSIDQALANLQNKAVKEMKKRV